MLLFNNIILMGSWSEVRGGHFYAELVFFYPTSSQKLQFLIFQNLFIGVDFSSVSEQNRIE